MKRSLACEASTHGAGRPCAKLMISEADAKLISDGGRSDFQWSNNTSFHFEPAKVDRLLRDKDKVELGGVTMIARITPGHTTVNNLKLKHTRSFCEASKPDA